MKHSRALVVGVVFAILTASHLAAANWTVENGGGFGYAKAGFASASSGVIGSGSIASTGWTFGADNDNFMGPFSAFVGIESKAQQAMPVGGTLSQLYVRGPVDNAAAGSGFVVTVRVNGADTAISCTITNPATSCSNTGASAPIAAGQLISVNFRVVGSVGSSTLPIRWTLNVSPS